MKNTEQVTQVRTRNLKYNDARLSLNDIDAVSHIMPTFLTDTNEKKGEHPWGGFSASQSDPNFILTPLMWVTRFPERNDGSSKDASVFPTQSVGKQMTWPRTHGPLTLMMLITNVTVVDVEADTYDILNNQL